MRIYSRLESYCFEIVGDDDSAEQAAIFILRTSELGYAQTEGFSVMDDVRQDTTGVGRDIERVARAAVLRGDFISFHFSSERTKL
jgi:hypothetical protein